MIEDLYEGWWRLVEVKVRSRKEEAAEYVLLTQLRYSQERSHAIRDTVSQSRNCDWWRLRHFLPSCMPFCCLLTVFY